MKKLLLISYIILYAHGASEANTVFPHFQHDTISSKKVEPGHKIKKRRCHSSKSSPNSSNNQSKLDSIKQVKNKNK